MPTDPTPADIETARDLCHWIDGDCPYCGADRADIADALATARADAYAAGYARGRAESDKLIGDLQNLVRDTLIRSAKALGVDGADAAIDGGGSDGGEIEFTAAELSVGLALIEEAAEAKGRAEGLREGADWISQRPNRMNHTHDPGGCLVCTLLHDAARDIRALAPHPEPTPGPRVPLTSCAAGSDGDCYHTECPQIRDGEPERSHRHCPLDTRGDDEAWLALEKP